MGAQLLSQTSTSAEGWTDWMKSASNFAKKATSTYSKYKKSATSMYAKAYAMKKKATSVYAKA